MAAVDLADGFRHSTVLQLPPILPVSTNGIAVFRLPCLAGDAAPSVFPRALAAALYRGLICRDDVLRSMPDTSSRARTDQLSPEPEPIDDVDAVIGLAWDELRRFWRIPIQSSPLGHPEQAVHHGGKMAERSEDSTMTTKVLGIDLHDAGRDGVYRVDPDDPITLVADAQRAGLPVLRVDLAGCRDLPALLNRVTDAAGLPAHASSSMDALDDALRDLDNAAAPGHVLLFEHADDLAREAPEVFAELRERLTAVAAQWHWQGVPFFVFLEFQDNETRDAAIDA